MKEITRLRNLPRRRAEAHKGDFGRVLVVAGSPGMTGAGCLTALGAQRAGAGLITLALPRSVAIVGEIFRSSIMSKALPDTPSGAISPEAAAEVLKMAKTADVCALGPGLGRSEQTGEFVQILARSLEAPLILDADALNLLARSPQTLKDRSFPTVITPHPGEMARLCGLDTARAVQRDRRAVAAAFARDTGTVTVLKGQHTVVADAERVYMNTSGNPGMATGGMGDVLTGIIAGLTGSGLEAFDAACLGTYVHGLAGDVAAERLGMTSMAPEDVLETICTVFARLEQLPPEFEATPDIFP